MSSVQVPNLPCTASELGGHLNIPNLYDLISQFLHEQENPEFNIPLNDIPLADCPQFKGNICMFPSAISIYHALSDKSGLQEMLQERIRAISSWR